MKSKSILAGLMLALLTSPALATSATIIDGSTPQTTNASVAAMRSELSPSENCQLTMAIARIKLGDEKQAAKEGKLVKAPEEPLGPLLDGLNYDEIIKLSRTYPGVIRSTCEQ